MTLIMTRKKYQILIIEDHPFVRQAYEFIFQEICQIEGNCEFHIQTASTINCTRKLIFEKSRFQVEFDIVILDIRIPKSINGEMGDSEVLGQEIKELMPETKIIVITSLRENFRLYNIFKSINPDSLLIKSEIDNDILKSAILSVLDNQTYYCNSISNILRTEFSSKYQLDRLDREILYCLSKGLRTKEISTNLPLSISGVEKRKRKLANIFGLNSSKTSNLMKEALKHGYI